jgi:hypothetical protein
MSSLSLSLLPAAELCQQWARLADEKRKAVEREVNGKAREVLVKVYLWIVDNLVTIQQHINTVGNGQIRTTLPVPALQDPYANTILHELIQLKLRTCLHLNCYMYDGLSLSPSRLHVWNEVVDPEDLAALQRAFEARQGVLQVSQEQEQEQEQKQQQQPPPPPQQRKHLQRKAKKARNSPKKQKKNRTH